MERKEKIKAVFISNFMVIILFGLLFLLLFLLSSCNKDEIVPPKYHDNISRIISVETPAGSFDNCYIFREQYTFTKDQKTGLNCVSYGIGYIYTDRCFKIGDESLFDKGIDSIVNKSYHREYY